MEQFLDTPVEDAARQAVRDAARLLASAGLIVDGFQLSAVSEARQIWWFFFGELPVPFTREVLQGREADAHWTSTELLAMTHGSHDIAGREVVEQLGSRDRMRAVLLRQMEKFPVLLMPVCAVSAFPHRTREWQIQGRSMNILDVMAPATPWNVLGMPGLSVPMGFDQDGLPVGVQLVGRPYEEELLLHIGEVLEMARGPLPGPPVFVD